MPQRRAAAALIVRSEGGGTPGLRNTDPCCSLHTAAGRDDVAFSQDSWSSGAAVLLGIFLFF